jgi:hypothetical protein
MNHDQLVSYIQGVLDANKKIKVEINKTTKIETLENGEIVERLIEKAIEKFNQDNPIK